MKSDLYSSPSDQPRSARDGLVSASQSGASALSRARAAAKLRRGSLATVALACLGAVACTGYVEFDEPGSPRPATGEPPAREPEGPRRAALPGERQRGRRSFGPRPTQPQRARPCRRDPRLHLRHVGLEYELTPTRSADRAALEGKGNCMSFVNLFVGLGRENRLNPFYVEVKDYQRWNYQDGVVVSRGHIVAGLYVDGDLRTYDFLPYAPKSYKDFKPIEDLTAMAHHYNNLGAEALMDTRACSSARGRPASNRTPHRHSAPSPKCFPASTTRSSSKVTPTRCRRRAPSGQPTGNSLRHAPRLRCANSSKAMACRDPVCPPSATPTRDPAPPTTRRRAEPRTDARKSSCS